LCLLTHGIGKSGRYFNVFDTNSLNCYTPWIGIFIQYRLQILSDLFAILKQIGQLMLANNVAQLTRIPAFPYRFQYPRATQSFSLHHLHTTQKRRLLHLPHLS
jgi:hypothetical protein